MCVAMSEFTESQMTYCSEAEKLLMAQKPTKARRRSERLSQKNKGSKTSIDKFHKPMNDLVPHNSPQNSLSRHFESDEKSTDIKDHNTNRFNNWHTLPEEGLEQFFNNPIQIQPYANSLPLANNIGGITEPATPEQLAGPHQSILDTDTSSNTRFIRALEGLPDEAACALDLSKASSGQSRDVAENGTKKKKLRKSTKSVNPQQSRTSIDKKHTKVGRLPKSKASGKRTAAATKDDGQLKSGQANSQPKKEIRPNYYLSHDAQRSVLPSVYPAYFTNQMPPTIIFDDMYRSPMPADMQPIPNSPNEQYFTTTKSTQSPATQSEVSSPRTPSLPESLRSIFESSDIRDILNIEKITYRLADTHVQTLAKVLNIDFDYLRSVIEKILKLNTAVLRRFNTAIDSVQLQSQNTADNMRMLNTLSKYSEYSKTPPKPTPKTPRPAAATCRSPSVFERTPSASPGLSRRLLPSQRVAVCPYYPASAPISPSLAFTQNPRRRK